MKSAKFCVLFVMQPHFVGAGDVTKTTMIHGVS